MSSHFCPLSHPYIILLQCSDRTIRRKRAELGIDKYARVADEDLIDFIEDYREEYADTCGRTYLYGALRSITQTGPEPAPRIPTSQLRRCLTDRPAVQPHRRPHRIPYVTDGAGSVTAIGELSRVNADVCARLARIISVALLLTMFVTSCCSCVYSQIKTRSSPVGMVCICLWVLTPSRDLSCGCQLTRAVRVARGQCGGVRLCIIMVARGMLSLMLEPRTARSARFSASSMALIL